MVFVPSQCPNKQSLPGCEHLTMAEALLLGPECPLPDTCRVPRGGQFSQEGGPEEKGTSQHLSHSLPPLCSQHETSTHTGLLAYSLLLGLCLSVFFCISLSMSVFPLVSSSKNTELIHGIRIIRFFLN